MTSDAGELQSILRRIETLETESRRLRRAGRIVVVAGLGAIMLMVQGTPEGRTVGAEISPDKPNFPDDSQINLLVTQSERSFETYEVTVKEEQLGLGEQGEESAARDRQVLERVRQYLPKLKANPQAFNSPAGFLLVVDLDDASRNMAVCMGQAGMDASLLAVAGSTSAGQSTLALAQACQGASQLLYTVSETAVSLYEKYLFANHDLQQREEGAVGKCMEILKKQGSPK
jgi:hypothetical protein